MATCPKCGKSSRDDDDLMTLEPVMVAAPIGSFSLSGAAMKVTATPAFRLSCRCGWFAIGQIEGEAFVARQDGQSG